MIKPRGLPGRIVLDKCFRERAALSFRETQRNSRPQFQRDIEEQQAVVLQINNGRKAGSCFIDRRMEERDIVLQIGARKREGHSFRDRRQRKSVPSFQSLTIEEERTVVLKLYYRGRADRSFRDTLCKWRGLQLIERL